MTFTVDGFEINITAKKDGFTRKQATLYFMNSLGCLYWDSANYDTMRNEQEPREYYTGEHGTIAQALNIAEEIHDQLKALGLYDN